MKYIEDIQAVRKGSYLAGGMKALIKAVESQGKRATGWLQAMRAGVFAKSDVFLDADFLTTGQSQGRMFVFFVFFVFFMRSATNGKCEVVIVTDKYPKQYFKVRWQWLVFYSMGAVLHALDILLRCDPFPCLICLCGVILG